MSNVEFKIRKEIPKGILVIVFLIFLDCAYQFIEIFISNETSLLESSLLLLKDILIALGLLFGVRFALILLKLGLGLLALISFLALWGIFTDLSSRPNVPDILLIGLTLVIISVIYTYLESDIVKIYFNKKNTS